MANHGAVVVDWRSKGPRPTPRPNYQVSIMNKSAFIIWKKTAKAKRKETGYASFLIYSSTLCSNSGRWWAFWMSSDSLKIFVSWSKDFTKDITKSFSQKMSQKLPQKRFHNVDFTKDFYKSCHLERFHTQKFHKRCHKKRFHNLDFTKDFTKVSTKRIFTATVVMICNSR